MSGPRTDDFRVERKDSQWVVTFTPTGARFYFGDDGMETRSSNWTSLRKICRWITIRWKWSEWPRLSPMRRGGMRIELDAAPLFAGEQGNPEPHHGSVNDGMTSSSPAHIRPARRRVILSLPPPGRRAGTFSGACAVTQASQCGHQEPLVSLALLDPLLESALRRAARPILIFVFGGRVDDARDMARAAEHEGHVAAEKLRAAKHGMRRRDMILPGRDLDRPAIFT